MREYRFNNTEEHLPVVLPANLILEAIKRAKQVKPADEIKEKWERAILDDMNAPDPKFSWANFLKSLLP